MPRFYWQYKIGGKWVRGPPYDPSIGYIPLPELPGKPTKSRLVAVVEE